MTVTTAPSPDDVEEFLAAPGDPLPVIRFRYRNHRGEIADRAVLPGRVILGRSQWHPEIQPMLLAYDMDRQADRSFAIRDILEWLPFDPPAVEAAPETAATEKSAFRFDDAAPPLLIELDRAELTTDEAGRLVHDGEPKWRAAPRIIRLIEDKEIVLSRDGDETVAMTKLKHPVGRVWIARGQWNAYVPDFEFWFWDYLTSKDDFVTIPRFADRQQAEDLLTSTLQQAGAKVQWI